MTPTTAWLHLLFIYQQTPE